MNSDQLGKARCYIDWMRTERSWMMKRLKLSKRASTRWDELKVVK